ncbi:MAG: hypothetical protein H0Z19_04570 [Archaeoglobus sp.]|nr:hypothetical protein [Archaeoglobus sp.]MBO8179742.1 hypothetical protein [Archaeoglobus sp.]
MTRTRVEIETEDFSKVIELPAALLKLVRSMPGNDKVQVLQTVKNGM